MQVYTGCLENQHGFYPLRDPKSKWFISYEEMPDSAVRGLTQTLNHTLMHLVPAWTPCLNSPARPRNPRRLSAGSGNHAYGATGIQLVAVRII